MTMPGVLDHLFVVVCGQNPEHTWAPGGLLLPLCQRCTGLYAGAAVAALLYIFIRPRLSSRWIELHGAFLLIMAPFGFHWLPQGPMLRTMTGVLFGFGVFTFLWLPVHRPPANSEAITHASKGSAFHWITYLVAVAVTLWAIPWLGAYGGSLAAYTLVTLTSMGAVALLVLVVANVALGLAAAIRSMSGPAAETVTKGQSRS